MTGFRRFVLDLSMVVLIALTGDLDIVTVRLSPKTVSGGEFGWGGTSVKR